MSKIYFHPLLIFVSLIFVLSGHFLPYILFISIIFIHEIGHLISAYFLKWNIDKIIIYPFGGCLKFKEIINKPIDEEFIIAVSGFLYQGLYLIFILALGNMGYIRPSTIDTFLGFNYILFIFNILPIYPLDGYKILNLFLLKILPFYYANLISLIISIAIIPIVIIYFLQKQNLILSLVILLLIVILIKYLKEYKYYFNKFLLERHLLDLSFKKTKYLKKSHLKLMFKDYYHFFKDKNIYLNEKELLKRIFH